MFNALFTKTEEYAKLAQALGGPGACALFGIPGAGRALVYAALSQALDRPLCIVTQMCIRDRPEPASYVFFYAFSNLRNLLYIIQN